MKIIFVGETWNGSSARSIRDSLSAINGVQVDDIGEDHYSPRGRSIIVRSINRILKPLYRNELAKEIYRRSRVIKPDAVVIFKGNLVSAKTIDSIKNLGIPIINIFPDASPHAHGNELKKAIGLYDLVISTKPHHPEHWKSTYGYENCCVCVPHGYDPELQHWNSPSENHDIDVAIAASWRPQYENLMVEVGKLLPDKNISFALAGPGWEDRRDCFPEHWQFPGALHGLAYGEFIRRAKIVVAPVHTEVIINGKQQPGDQDTKRTYELAAAATFFLHRRTPFSSQTYIAGKECDFWSDARELAEKIIHYLPREEERRSIALAAHRRAVPAYSTPARAQEIVSHIANAIERYKQKKTKAACQYEK